MDTIHYLGISSMNLILQTWPHLWWPILRLRRRMNDWLINRYFGSSRQNIYEDICFTGYLRQYLKYTGWPPVAAISFEQEMKKQAEWATNGCAANQPIYPFPIESLLSHPVKILDFVKFTYLACTERPVCAVQWSWPFNQAPCILVIYYSITYTSRFGFGPTKNRPYNLIKPCDLYRLAQSALNEETGITRLKHGF